MYWNVCIWIIYRKLWLLGADGWIIYRKYWLLGADGYQVHISC